MVNLAGSGTMVEIETPDVRIPAICLRTEILTRKVVDSVRGATGAVDLQDAIPTHHNRILKKCTRQTLKARNSHVWRNRRINRNIYTSPPFMSQCCFCSYVVDMRKICSTSPSTSLVRHRYRCARPLIVVVYYKTLKRDSVTVDDNPESIPKISHAMHGFRR